MNINTFKYFRGYEVFNLEGFGFIWITELSITTLENEQRNVSLFQTSLYIFLTLWADSIIFIYSIEINGRVYIESTMDCEPQLLLLQHENALIHAVVINR